MAQRTIPPWVIEYLLLGKTHQDAVQRYTQDGGVVADVWIAFANDLTKPVRVLLSPAEGTTAPDMAYELHRCLKAYRKSPNARYGFETIGPRETNGVATLKNYVAATLYIDELLRVAMPLTRWWSERKLGRMRHKAADSYPLVQRLQDEIIRKLGAVKAADREKTGALVQNADGDLRATRDYRIIEAAPIATLIGVIRMVMDSPTPLFTKAISDGKQDSFGPWIAKNATKIAQAAQHEFQQPLVDALAEVQKSAEGPASETINAKERSAPAIVQRVFLDRNASVSQNDALAAIKSDAATRVFEISCAKIAWGVIDSGIAANHPAFFDWSAIDASMRTPKPLDPWNEDTSQIPNRIRAIYDFTLIDQIRNYDLTDHDSESAAGTNAIDRVIALLEALPGRKATDKWRELARANLRRIAEQLSDRQLPDWRLIEPLIRVDADDGSNLPSDHGTHVAGTLGADWRRLSDDPLLEGACRDIYLYDLRVIPAANAKRRGGSLLESTEFAVVAATEFVQYLNAAAGPNGPVIHGVNISMSIPHDVRNYGCGATPVCVACDALVSSGVVVVAAAGNRGWNEQEIGFGNFSFCSITDPGNAYDVITVGSTHRSRPHTYGVSYFSSRGPTGDGRLKPDLVAPGEKIRGPVRGAAYEEFDGTSMASPFVSGAAAMLMAHNRELIRNPKRVKQILCDSATDLGRERYFQGHGMLDVLRALQKQ